MKRNWFTQKDINHAENALKRFQVNHSGQSQFYELCFAICSPQIPIEANIEFNERLKDIDFYNQGCPMPQLIKMCSRVRFKHRKARFLKEAREKWHTGEIRGRVRATLTAQQGLFDPKVMNLKMPNLKVTLKQHLLNTGSLHAREYLVENVPGLGYKTASHFLRNAFGVMDLAILDTHILQAMEKEGIWKRPEKFAMTRSHYLKLEEKLWGWAEELNVPIAVLDTIIFVKGSGCWYDQLR